MKLKRATSAEVSQQIIDATEEEFEPILENRQISWESVPVVHTGSTLLDLAISGGRLEFGGIPACILVEVHGPSGSGKTAILSETGADAQEQGGDIQYQDPEFRLDLEYSRIYGMALSKKNYYRPLTVDEVFRQTMEWKTDKLPKVQLTDSLAALTTEMEMETGDKMGMRRAKEFSKGFRLAKDAIASMLWMCSNQERDSDNGIVTPGGRAIAYYSSLRIRVRQVDKIFVEKTIESGVKVKKAIGILSECFIGKSTVDDPYRTAPIHIVFGYGIDDIRGNLQYIKDMKKDTTYICPDGKSYRGMDQAIIHVEENDLSKQLKKNTAQLWHEIENLFQMNRSRRKQR